MNAPAEAVELERLWGIRGPAGTVDHTSLVYGTAAECISGFLMREAACLGLMSRLLDEPEPHAQGWVVYEAQGYECIRVRVVPEGAE